jgi:enoyl-[acyl-carrier protein] reductase I
MQRSWQLHPAGVNTNMSLQLIGGKRGLVVGIANGHSIAAGCARAFCDAGAQLAITYVNDKAKPYVQPVADEVKSDLMLPLDVEDDAQVDAVFERIEADWGELDFLLHSIAYCPMKDSIGHGR